VVHEGTARHRDGIVALSARLRAATPVPPSFDHLHADDLLRRLRDGHSCLEPDSEVRWIAGKSDSVEDAEPVEPVKIEPVKPDAALLTVDQAAAYLTVTDERTACRLRAGRRASVHQCRSWQEATALQVHQARP